MTLWLKKTVQNCDCEMFNCALRHLERYEASFLEWMTYPHCLSLANYPSICSHMNTHRASKAWSPLRTCQVDRRLTRFIFNLIQCFNIRVSQYNQETFSIVVYQSWIIILLNCQMQQIKMASQSLFTKTEGENLKTARRTFLLQLLLRADRVNVTQGVDDRLWQPLVKTLGGIRDAWWMKAELGDAGSRHVLTTRADFSMNAYFLRRAAAPFLELNSKERAS